MLKKCEKCQKNCEKTSKKCKKIEKNEKIADFENFDSEKVVLLVGNPNSGKTTLFNALTHSDEHVGNWHGVTVDTAEQSFSVCGEDFLLVDTPGLYSLCALSFEEKVASEMILQHKHGKIINVCDQNNIARNLYLTLCLLECGLDVVLAVNEIDKKPIFKIDYEKMSEILKIPVVQINAQKKINLDKLKEKLTQKNQQKFRAKYLENLKIDKKLVKFDEKNLKKLSFSQNLDDFLKIKTLENDENYVLENSQENVQKLAEKRYEFVDEIIEKCTKRTNKTYGKSKLDKLFLNKFLAIPAFFLIMMAVFYLTFFSLGSFCSDALASLLSLITNPILSQIQSAFGDGAIYDFFNVAIVGGVGSVLSFLPQVVLLFFFLSVMEDSGYISRVAFVFEDVLSKIGLSGKSIYTLLMGFGCSTSAIMTARNMEDKNAKIKTALLCPYMSCSAKIPIYTVIGGAFFGAKNIFVIVGLYFLGIFVSICVSKILDSTLLKSEHQSFILEFPPYRMISFKRVFKVLWKNSKEFLLRVGSVMVVVNIVVWALSNFSFSLAYVGSSGGSILETLGKILEPIFKPLGFGSWAIVAALLAGFVAKEVVVSSIAMFNGVEAGSVGLISASILSASSLVHFSSVSSAISFLVFCLLYTPCVSSLSMLCHEVGKKWAFFGAILQLLTAYALCFVIYNFSFAVELFGFFKVFCAFLMIFAIIFSIFLLYKKIKSKNPCFFCKNAPKCGKKLDKK